MAGLNKSHESVSPFVMTDNFDNPCSVDDVRAQVARIMVSEEFHRSPRLRRFLQFIVDEHLSGREGQIKAYTIGLAVCDRDEQFDPSIDPIVRIEAGRLRRALEHYYLTQGANDAIAIDVPKGAYRPVITSRPEFRNPLDVSHGLPPHVLQRLVGNASLSSLALPPVPQPAQRDSFFRRMAGEARPAWLVAALAVISFGVAVSFMDRETGRIEPGVKIPAHNLPSELAIWRMPTVLVLPFHGDDGDTEQSSVADAVTDGITQYLMQQPDLNIRRTANATSGAMGGSYEGPSIDFVVSGSVRKVDNHVRVFVQLTNVVAEASVWSQNYDYEMHGDLFDRQDDIARSIVTQVAKLSVRAAPVTK